MAAFLPIAVVSKQLTISDPITGITMWIDPDNIRDPRDLAPACDPSHPWFQPLNALFKWLDANGLTMSDLHADQKAVDAVNASGYAVLVGDATAVATAAASVDATATLKAATATVVKP